jgi:hypothetical protein
VLALLLRQLAVELALGGTFRPARLALREEVGGALFERDGQPEEARGILREVPIFNPAPCASSADIGLPLEPDAVACEMWKACVISCS